jgi:hypothetical protein
VRDGEAEWTIKEPLSKYVDGYLMEDLASMAAIDKRGDGNVGYPMLMTIL